MKIAITGGSGAIGTHTCNALIAEGHEVTSLDRTPPRAEGAKFIELDLLDLDATGKAVESFDQIIHLAAIPHPFADPPDKLMAVNMPLTFNIFEAARKVGVPRVIYGSSASGMGFGIHHYNIKPLYVPIDEEHPCWPHETYSFTKYFGDVIAENYARAYGMETMAMRYDWVWVERDGEGAKNIVAASREGKYNKDLWYGSHNAVKDVAAVLAAAVKFQFTDPNPGYECFLVAAESTCHPIPTLDVLQELYGELPPIKNEKYFQDNPYASVFDIRKAKRMLNWSPKYNWRTDELEF